MSNSLLQKSLRNFTCTQEGHQQQPLDYVCLALDCQNQQRVICYLCSLQSHLDHEKVPIRIFLKQIMSISQNSQQVIHICAQIDDKFQQIKTKISKNSASFTFAQVVNRTFQQYRKLQIQSILQFFRLVEKTVLMFQQSKEKVIDRLNWFVKNIYKKYFSDIKPEQWSKTNLAETVIGNKIQLVNGILETLEKLQTIHKFNDNQVLSLFPLKVEEDRKVKVYFSEDLKPNNMTLLSSTHAKMLTSGSERLLVLQPCLSSKFLSQNVETQSIKKWGVKILKLASWIGVGVCHINAIKDSKFMFNYTNTGHGNYLISSNGYSWSSYQKQYNSKFEPFTYTTGDVIHIEYNPRQRVVRFKKESDPNQPTYQLQVEANDDPIHPEINLTGVNDQVQIINF